MTIKNSDHKSPLFKNAFARRLVKTDETSFDVQNYISKLKENPRSSLFGLNEAFKDGVLSFEDYFTTLINNSDRKLFLEKANNIIVSEEKQYTIFLNYLFDFNRIVENGFSFIDEELAKKLLLTFPEEPNLNYKIEALIDVLCYSGNEKHVNQLRKAFKPFVKFLKKNNFLNEVQKLSIKISFKN